MNKRCVNTRVLKEDGIMYIHVHLTYKHADCLIYINMNIRPNFPRHPNSKLEGEIK